MSRPSVHGSRTSGARLARSGAFVRMGWAAVALAGLAGPLAALQTPEEPAVPAPAESVSSPDANLPAVAVTAPKPAYRSLAETLALLEEWHAARPATTRLVDLGRSTGGRRILGLEVFSEGPLPPEERPTLLFVGGLDGLSLHGAEEVLGIAAGLAQAPDELPGDYAFLCVPWASPDGLAQELASLEGSGVSTLGRDVTPIDDDLDGASGEDPADDVDGDGLVTMMLVEDVAGPWRRATDARFLLPFDHELASGPRYVLAREGRDDDEDGAFNEDGPGGVRSDRNFPVGWLGPFAPSSPGMLPLEVRPARALTEWAEGRALAGAWFFDGHGGRPEVSTVAGPSGGGASGALVEVTRDLFGGALDAPIEGLEVRVLSARGSALDWFAARGDVAVRVPFWGPEIGLGRTTVRSAGMRGDEFVPPAELLEDFCSPEHGAASGGAWRRYLDERRGGIGFVDWHPVDLGGTRRALVGGWEPAVLHNPPTEQLERSVIMAMGFVGALLEALPEPAIEVEAATREGELCSVTARIVRANPREGRELAIDFLAPEGLELALLLPPGARLIAGPAELVVDDQTLGQSIEWLVYLPEDAMVDVVLRHQGPDPEHAYVIAQREVRP